MKKRVARMVDAAEYRRRQGPLDQRQGPAARDPGRQDPQDGPAEEGRLVVLLDVPQDPRSPTVGPPLHRAAQGAPPLPAVLAPDPALDLDGHAGGIHPRDVELHDHARRVIGQPDIGHRPHSRRA